MLQTWSRHVIRLSVAGAVLIGFGLPSCGGDDESSGGGGNGGKGGGGTSGTAGEGGTADTGGTSGNAGTPGAGGRGGGGGSAGVGGDAGAGADGGTDTGGTNMGGVGADAGNGGTPGGGAGGEGGEETQGTGEVTPEGGGTVTLGTTTVVVPPGAVATRTTITIRPLEPSSVAAFPAGFERIGPMVALLPHGFTFSQPVEITLGHTRGAGLVDPVVLRLADEVDTTWETLASSSFDATSVRYSATTFSGVAPAVPVSSCSPALVISAIYAMGGRSTTEPDNDFVELHNRGSSALNLNGLALQVNDGGSVTAWSVVPLSGTLAAGGYYLVGLGRDNLQTGLPIPTPDATGTFNLVYYSGRLAITAGTTPLSGGPPWTFVSAVAFGSTNWMLEGQAISLGALTDASILERNDMGCAWTGANTADVSIVARRTPFNTASTPRVCACP